MKAHLQQLLTRSILRLQETGVLPRDISAEVSVERTRDKRFGDFTSNFALAIAKEVGRKPRDLAQQLIAALPAAPQVAKVDVAGAGFINFFLSPAASRQVVTDILKAGHAYGRATTGVKHRIQVEFVSANPTGPLHVGHGRGAAYGSVLASLLEAAGFDVHREYYVNDSGRQMDILATSVWLRYLELCGEKVAFPSRGYRGDYIYDIARRLRDAHGKALLQPSAEVTAAAPADTEETNEEYIDVITGNARRLLGPERYGLVFDLTLEVMLADIRDDLEEFGVVYDEWFSERSLTRNGSVQRCIDQLKASGHLYEEQGAWWFRSTDFGDEKDRVVIRENGQMTYFASDIAYHAGKMQRGFDRVIDVWGADHHGYVPRIKAALTALGHDASRLQVLLVQFAILYRGGKKAQMSTRSGEFITLRELRKEVGNDAVRYFYVMRKCEQHMDFDLDLAKSQSNDNPVYYVQYAHARICSVMRQLEEKRLSWDPAVGNASLKELHEEHEQNLMATLSRYPEVVETAALAYEPHQVIHYLRELATDFHTYYNAHQFLVASETLRNARLNLILATRQVLRNALGLLGVAAPETM
jgi:arginyl-tRNA synthetase